MGDLNDHFHSNRKEEKNEQFKDRRHGHKCATGSHNNRGTSVLCISTSDRTCGVDLMRWYTGKPREDGMYYIASPSTYLIDFTTHKRIDFANITTLPYTVEGGWNTFREPDGTVAESNYSLEGDEVWADVMPPFKAKYLEWYERLQDILDEVDGCRAEDPHNDGGSYSSESEADYYYALDELRDHLETAIDFAREVA